MKKMKKCNKGFTLTELAIVIAVIAILIAVLVPTFISLMNKAEESSDKQLVKNLNTSLSTYEAINGETDGVIEAIAALKEEGYDVTKLTPTSDDAVIAYNTTTHTFVLYSGNFETLSYGEVNDGDNLVVIGCSTATATAASALNITEYCIYSEDGATVECTVEGVKIYVYTEKGTSTINAPSAEVYHYGEAETVEITAVASESYHLFAQVETVKIAFGHVVVEDGSSITKLVVNTDTAGAVTTTLNSDTATIGRVVTADTSFKVVDSAGKEVTTISTVTVSSVADLEEMETVTYITSEPSTITSGTYVLSGRITGNFVIPEGAIVTIDLNGWTVKGGQGTINNAAFTNYGTLIITGSGNVTCYGSGIDAAVYSEYGANTYIDGGTYTQGNWYLLHNYGYMEINDAIIIGSSSTSSVVHNGYYSTADFPSTDCDEAVMIINGMSFGNDTSAVAGTSSLIKNDGKGNLTINDGIFANAPAYIVLNWNICTINGGTFSRSSGNLIYNSYSNEYAVGELTINGGTFKTVTAVYQLYNTKAATLIINGGFFEKGAYTGSNTGVNIYGGQMATKASQESTVKTNYVYVADGYYTYTDTEPVEGTYEACGTVGNTSSKLSIIYYFKDADDVSLINPTGCTIGTLYLYGTFNGGRSIYISDNESYVFTIVYMNSSASIGDITLKPYKDGYETIPTETTEDGNKVIAYTAVMTENSANAYAIVNGEKVYYATLNDAAKANVGGTIYLNKNLSSTSYYSISYSVTIDLNGKTISSSYSSGTLYTSAADIDITIKDSVGGGKIENSNTKHYAIYLYTTAYRSSIYVDSSVKLAGNIYFGCYTAELYLADTSVFTDSTYDVITTLSGHVINSKSLTVEGAAVTWYYATASDASTAQAYFYKNDTAIYTTLSNAVRVGGTVYVNTDFSFTYVSISNDVTIDLCGHSITGTSNSYTFTISSNCNLVITDSNTGDKGSVSNTGTNKVVASVNASASISVESGITINGDVKLSKSDAVACIAEDVTFGEGYGVISGLSGYTVTPDTESQEDYTKYYLVVSE